MELGIVIFFNKKNGFGFIKSSGDNMNYYVREKNLLEPVEAKDKVVFDLREARRGKEAVKVKKVV